MSKELSEKLKLAVQQRNDALEQLCDKGIIDSEKVIELITEQDKEIRLVGDDIPGCPPGCGGCACHLNPPCGHCEEGHDLTQKELWEREGI